jgi:hypothetical protein
MVVMVPVVVVTMMMVAPGSEHRSGNHHQEQGCHKNFFHGENLAQTLHNSEGGNHPLHLQNV